MTNSSEHRDRGAFFECRERADMVRWIGAKLGKMGGHVLLGPDRENLCRRARLEEIAEIPSVEWIVEAQGLPNLIHEFVHALFLGHLDDDHGFDYKEIPLDMTLARHRRQVWEELTCCGASAAICAPLYGSPSRFMREWFREQVEIQGIFHGLEHDLDAFCAHLDRQLSTPEFAMELEQTVREGYERIDAAMAEVGGPRELPRCDLQQMWRDYRELRANETKRTLAGSGL